jgi:hypothetical protein
MQLKIDDPFYVIFEWIPYNQFYDMKVIGKGGFATVYSAIWKGGPMLYHHEPKKEIKRVPDKKVALKCLYGSQNINKFNKFLDEV